MIVRNLRYLSHEIRKYDFLIQNPNLDYTNNCESLCHKPYGHKLWFIFKQIGDHSQLHNNSACLLVLTLSNLIGSQELSFNRSEVNKNTLTILTLFIISHQHAVCHASLCNCSFWFQFNPYVF